MLFRMIYDDRLAQAAYLIGCQRTGEAIIIDPERDIDRYLALAAREKVRITSITETHIHADFLSGARELAEKTGAHLYLSACGDADWQYQWLSRRTAGGAYAHTLVRDGSTFRVGNIEFKVVHTPGHTPEHICFMVTDHGGGAAEPMGIATGDFVFVGDVGRPDLLETAAGVAGAKEPSARNLYHSLQRFSKLPEYLQVWPAHGAGSACGKALGAVPQSTVGYEKRFNAAIRATADGEKAFVSSILTGQPDPPLYFARMKRENKMGPRVLGSLPRPGRLSITEAAAIDARVVTLIDTRPWKEFKASHIPGALWIPMDNMFPSVAGSFIAEDEMIYVCAAESALDEVIRCLVRVGLDDVRAWIDPVDMAQVLASRPGASIKEMDTPAVVREVDAPHSYLLDVRNESEFEAGHIPGAELIPYTRLADHVQELPDHRPIIINCKSGGRSGRACAFLQRAGYDVINLAGGFDAWSAAGAPVERPSAVTPA